MPARIPITERQRMPLLALHDTKAMVVRHHGFDGEELSAIGIARTQATSLDYALQLCRLPYPGRHLRAGELLPAIAFPQPGDLIERVNGAAVGDANRDRALFASAAAAGDPRRIELIRNGRRIAVSLPAR